MTGNTVRSSTTVGEGEELCTRLQRRRSAVAADPLHAPVCPVRLPRVACWQNRASGRFSWAPGHAGGHPQHQPASWCHGVSHNREAATSEGFARAERKQSCPFLLQKNNLQKTSAAADSQIPMHTECPRVSYAQLREH
jgi:hypothetical protein